MGSNSCKSLLKALTKVHFYLLFILRGTTDSDGLPDDYNKIIISKFSIDYVGTRT